MNIVSYDQRKNYSEKVKLRNIDLDRGKVQSTFYTLVAPHIVDSDPFPPLETDANGWKTIKNSLSFKTRDYSESNKKWRVYSLKNTTQFLETKGLQSEEHEAVPRNSNIFFFLSFRLPDLK